MKLSLTFIAVAVAVALLGWLWAAVLTGSE